jgi:hypothetical protein
MLGGVVEINGAPFDVKDTVRTTAGHRGINAARASGISGAASPTEIIRPQVVPVGEDGVVVAVPGQADVSEGSLRRRELGVAVGGKIDGCVSLIVERERKGKWKVSDYIVPVVTRVCRARHTIAAYLIYRVLADARCWRRTDRRRRRR